MQKEKKDFVSIIEDDLAAADDDPNVTTLKKLANSKKVRSAGCRSSCRSLH